MSVSIDTKGIIEKVFDSFKRITPALFSIAVLTGLLLFLPKTVLERMSLANLPEVWNRIIGIVFLLSVTLILTIITLSIVSRIRKRIINKIAKRKMRMQVVKLSPRQRAIIVSLLHSEDKSIKLDKNSGDTVYLEGERFIYMPQQAFSLGWNNEMILTFLPQPWLLELYNEEPELFE